MRKTLYALLALPLLACACTNGTDKVEKEATDMLNTARSLMISGNYAQARDTILSMRKRCPTALEARAVGIIVMDSIELLEAQDSLSIMDSTLQAEEDLLTQMEATKRRGHNAEYYKQRTKVFHLKQRFDEMGAKVKFYLRKIEVDQNENKQAAEDRN